MQNRLNSTIIASAGLFITLSATLAVGVLGLLFNLITAPESPFNRVISNTSAIVSLAVFAALIGLLTQRRILQLLGGIVIFVCALHSLLAGLQIDKAFNWPWLQQLDNYFYPPVAAVFLVLAVTVTLNPQHRIQRWWTRGFAIILQLCALAMMALHLIPNGFAYIGPHPPVTSIAALIIFMFGITLLLLSSKSIERYILPTPRMGAVLFLYVLFIFSTWFSLSLSHLRNIESEANAIVARISETREQTVQVNIQLMSRLVERWQALDIAADDDYVKYDASLYLRDIPHMIAMHMFTDRGEQVWQQYGARIDDYPRYLDSAEVQNWLNQPKAEISLLIPRSRLSAEMRPLALMMIPTQPQRTDSHYLLAVLDLLKMLQPDTRLLPGSLRIYGQLNGQPLISFDNQPLDLKQQFFLADTTFTMPFGPNMTLSASMSDFVELEDASNLRMLIVIFALLFGVSYLIMAQQTLAVLQHRQRLDFAQQELRQQQRELDNNEQRFNALYERNPDAVFALDPQGLLVRVNQAVLDILKRPREEVLQHHFAEFVISDDLDTAQTFFQRVLNGETVRYELRIRDSLGAIQHIDVNNLPTIIDGKVTGAFGIAKDVTERKRQEAQLLLLQRSVDVSVNGVVIADAQQPGFPLVYINDRFEQVTGFTRADALGQNCRFLQGRDTNQASVQRIRDALAQQQELRIEILNYRKNGEPFWNELKISPVRDQQGVVTHFIGIQNDVTDLVNNQRQLSYQASHDLLTGLPNRESMEQALADYVQQAMRQTNPDGLLAVLFIDLDGFKPINDSLGLEVGDSILIEVAKRLRKCFRGSQMATRFGGDEFVGVIADCASMDELLTQVHHILQSIAQPYDIDPHKIYLTASMGITIWQAGINEPMSLIQQADIAMTQAKRQGRNHFQFYTGRQDESYQASVMLRSQLQQAIDNQQLQLYYQPIIDLATHSVVGVEALMRWQLADGSFVSPAEFIPLAESTGQIIPASAWALDQACMDLKQLERFGPLKMAVNLSALQFNRADFYDNVIATVAAHQIPPNSLELELTESILMDDMNHAISVLQRFYDANIHVCIDDFGTGFSSLSYLQRLPVQKLKIDRAFIDDLNQHASSKSIVQGIIAMAQQLNIAAVAEGIETAEQAAEITAMGCPLAQGFYFAKPMPMGELQQFLSQYKAPNS